MKRKGSITSFIFLLLVLLCPTVVFSQGKGKSLKDYEKWVKDSYLPEKQKDYQSMESTVSSSVAQWGKGAEAPYLRGNMPGALDFFAGLEGEKLKMKDFLVCNDLRILSWKKFFKEPNSIFFVCPDDTKGDKKTGNELKDLLCRIDKGACGIHFDNQHPSYGGSIGIGILFVIPTGLPICRRFYITATYVEYYFPWFLINTSRQMYQSAYIDRGFVEVARQLGKIPLFLQAMMQTGSDIALVQEQGNKEAQRALGLNTGLSNPLGSTFNLNWLQAAAPVQAMTNFAKSNPQLTDLSPHSTKAYARNLSTVLEIELINKKKKYKHVPHYPLDGHRFGTDFPNYVFLTTPNAANESKPGKVIGTVPKLALPKLALEKPPPPKKLNVGGLLHARFLSLTEKAKSKRIKEKFKTFLGKGGAKGSKGKNSENSPYICLSSHKQEKRTPEDLLPNKKAKQEKGEICIPKVVNRFPLLADSFSPYDSDAFWRAVLTGGIDTFYALNWPKFLDMDPGAQLAAAVQKPKKPGFHTYLAGLDRVTFGAASDARFAQEVFPQFMAFPLPPKNSSTLFVPAMCPTIDKPQLLIMPPLFINSEPLPKDRLQYKKGNIHTPTWGAQNTFIVWGLVKGLWGFRGVVAPVIPRFFFPPWAISRNYFVLFRLR
ncbi:MAG: hypothetical protein D6780_02075 [Candidatus Dadabacteria bacterium]|nr:MAG: hypothetical protein D6780_02075 [Candidatus Dadabacteria bacterium]